MKYADIIELAGDDYRKNHPLSLQQHKILNAIASCRTAQLGGHLERCDQCDYERPVYNSCRNRHCPKCQGFDTYRWVQEREAELLPIQYFHIVFTLPHELNLLAQYNPERIYTLLFESATETLQKFAEKNGRVNWVSRLFYIPWDSNYNNITIYTALSLVVCSPTTNNAGSTHLRTICSKSKTWAPFFAANSATN